MTASNIKEDFNNAIQLLDHNIREILHAMQAREDWVVDGQESIENAMLSLLSEAQNEDDFSIRDSYLASQILGWLSAPTCIVALQNISKVHPNILRIITSKDHNDPMIKIVVERLVVLERVHYLKEILDPESVRSISHAIKTFKNE